MPDATPTPAEELMAWYLDSIAGKQKTPPSLSSDSDPDSLLVALNAITSKPMRRAPAAEVKSALVRKSG